MKTEFNLAHIILVEEEFYKRKFIKYVLLVLTAVCRMGLSAQSPEEKKTF